MSSYGPEYDYGTCKGYMPVSSSSDTETCYAYPHQVAYGSNEETYRKMQEREKQPTKEQQFLMDRRNHEIRMSWKKQYQGKTYARFK
jgi:hypothetical protein